MKRTRVRTPNHLRSVEKVELSQNHLALRIAATVFFLIVGASALAYGISGLINGDRGWREIKAYTSEGTTCSGDFVLLYDVGSVKSVSKENRAVTALYTEATKDGYELFNAEVEIEGVHNLKYLSLHPNEDVEVAPALYQALEKYVKSGDRSAYLAPDYSSYDSIFNSSPEMSYDFDPAQNVELTAFFKEVADFARDPLKIDLKLLGNNKVRLFVSEDYLAFIEAEEITELINLYWLKNAFIADMIAQRFEEADLTACVISSVDGYSRCIDKRGENFDLTLYHLEDRTVYPAAIMSYQKRMSTVSLRAYPVSENDQGRYLDLGDEIRSQHLDVQDGMNRTSLPEIYGMSEDADCADIALALAPLFVTGEFSRDDAAELPASGISAVWFEDDEIVTAGNTPEISLIFDDGEKKFTQKSVNQ